MKFIIFIAIAVSLCLAGAASAGDNGYMISRMLERQSSGIDGVLVCFKNDCLASEYKEHLLKIVSAETNLIVFGVSPKDKRLVSNLASDVRTPADLAIFGYRLFKRRLLELTGFSPSPAGSFNGNSFKVFSNSDTATNMLTVSFK